MRRGGRRCAEWMRELDIGDLLRQEATRSSAARRHRPPPARGNRRGKVQGNEGACAGEWLPAQPGRRSSELPERAGGTVAGGGVNLARGRKSGERGDEREQDVNVAAH